MFKFNYLVLLIIHLIHVGKGCTARNEENVSNCGQILHEQVKGIQKIRAIIWLERRGSLATFIPSKNLIREVQSTYVCKYVVLVVDISPYYTQ